MDPEPVPATIDVAAVTMAGAAGWTAPIVTVAPPISK
jgi:hypothetical protein